MITLVYCFNDDRCKYDEVLDCIDEFLGCQKSIAFERANCLGNRQQPGESIIDGHVAAETLLLTVL